MKNILAIIAMIMLSTPTIGQNHITEKINLTNSIWVEYRHFGVQAYCNLITTTEDTLLADGHRYLKLFNSSDTTTSKGTYDGGIRFDSTTNRIYYTNIWEAPAILYDFSLNIGDTLTKAKGYYLSGNYDNRSTPIMVINIDTIQTEDGVSRRRFHIGPYPNAMFQIVEGIGNISAHFNKVIDLLLGGEIEEPTFSCYRQNSKCIIAGPTANCSHCFPIPLGVNDVSKQQEKENLVYPNPVTNLLYIKPIQSLLTQLLVFNINGQLVLTQSLDLFNQNIGIDVSALPKGIYTYEFTTSKNNTIRNKFIRD